MTTIILSITIILAQLRRKQEEFYLTRTQGLVASFSLMLILMLMGFIALRTLDYYRDRAKRFLPLFDVLEDFYNSMRQSYWALCLASGAVVVFCNENWGIATFVTLSILMLVSNRIDLERQRRFIAGVCAETAEAMRSAIPIDQFFEVLCKDYYASKSLKNTSLLLKQGISLSEALQKSDLLPDHAIWLIRAGEAGGGAALERTLRLLSERLRIESRSSSKLVTATIFPFLAWTFAFVVCLLISRGSILHLISLFNYYGPGRFGYVSVCHYSVFVGASSLMMLGLVFVYFGFKQNLHAVRMFDFVRKLVYAMPVLGQRRRHRELALICEAMSAMVRSDVPLWTAFRLVGTDEVAGMYAPMLRQLADRLENGATIQEALRGSNLPESVTCLLIAGAAGGTLAEAFSAAAEWHDSRALKLDHALSTIIPCIMIPLAGLIVGVAYGSVFWVLMEIRESIMIHAGQVH